MEFTKDFTATLRGELSALFGIRWDSFVEWTVITWLTSWFWVEVCSFMVSISSPLNSPEHIRQFVGPVSGLEDFIRGIGINSPGWLSGLLNWLHTADHAWIYWAALLTSVIASVASSRSQKYTGLRVLGLLSVATACEIQGDMWPILWVILIAAIPAGLACILDLVDSTREESKYDEYQYYFMQGIAIQFLVGIVVPYLYIIFSPVVILYLMVVCFRADITVFDAEKISVEVTKEMEHLEGGGVVEMDWLTQVASTAALTLAGNQSREARAILGHYARRMRKRREQRSLP